MAKFLRIDHKRNIKQFPELKKGYSLCKNLDLKREILMRTERRKAVFHLERNFTFIQKPALKCL